MTAAGTETDLTKAFTGPLASLMEQAPLRLAAEFLGTVVDAGASRIHFGDMVDIARSADSAARATDPTMQVSASNVRTVLEALRGAGVAELRSCPTGKVRQVSGEAETLQLQADGAPNTEFFYRINLERLRELCPETAGDDVFKPTSRRLRMR